MKNRITIPQFLTTIGIRPASTIGKLAVKIIRVLGRYERHRRQERIVNPVV